MTFKVSDLEREPIGMFGKELVRLIDKWRQLGASLDEIMVIMREAAEEHERMKRGRPQ